ncbi:MAG: hypothetical protein HOG41_22370 [Gammaproteobacteria bacterium]|mgnify:CR=1 FL=1|jgi:hypothetical protein|nr:hypothetical protein [Gammaproteobacteria bacterium]MBT4451680.1 hypothetical protein [Gammaproteobacteria bacterium]MBT4861778.1 hypothetical protein [Gammaproteobacteria bacterium]MBT6454003.1 hypothetical protein [Gammaproteobacteria bacterium]MBT7047535.1 hypothetical protein [Gammaproteobacteria bacterium]
MKNILEKFFNREIGINIERPLRIDSVTLTSVSNNYFSVIDENKGYTHHFSYNSIIQIIEHQDGIDVGGLFEHKKHFNLVIKVGHIPEFTPM